MKFHQIILITISLLLITGCSAGDAQKSTITQPTVKVSEPKISVCDQLASDLDNNLGKGLATPEDLIVGGTLVDIAGPEIHDYPGHIDDRPSDFHYELTFQGKSKTATFKFYTDEQIEVPLSEGKFYKFNLLRAYGAITSMGPHNGMFSYEENIFLPVTC